jgi:hypothetical protein
MNQPKILSDAWGEILIEWQNGKIKCKDAIIFPTKAKEWDWNWTTNDGMHHIPGIRIKDLDHFLSYE